MRSQLEVAIEYARNGIPVFPCTNDKVPIVTHGFLDATTDETLINKWWKKYPNALIGMPSSYATVMDVDDYDLCQTNQVLVDFVKKELDEFGFFPKHGFTVKTQSGGTHVYFKPCEQQNRTIGSLPCIDLLGKGGYSIAPDQNNYVANVEEPWKEFSSLPVFDMETYIQLTEKHHEIAVVSKTLKKKRKEERKQEVSSSVTLNYQKDEVKFEQTPNMYETSDHRDKENGFTYNGKPIEIERGILTEEILKGMFYNKINQEKMARYLNVPIPSETKTQTFKSLIPNHQDEKPSMGSRWSQDNSRIIVRDFSNHYSDKYHQNDYNLVRLYTTIIYKNQTPRFSSGEFNMWFLRLMYDSGIISLEFDEYFRENELQSESNNMKMVAEGFRALTAFKKLYKDFDNKIIFADRFAAGWCGVPLSTANRMKQKLINDGYLRTKGMMNLSQKSDTEFFRTKVLEMVI